MKSHENIARLATALTAAGGIVVAAGIIGLWPYPLRVVDGDTVERGLVRYRLVGYDAPKTRRGRYRCEAERLARHEAAVRLGGLIGQTQHVELVPLHRQRDPFGRVLAWLEPNGEDVARRSVVIEWVGIGIMFGLMR